MANDEAVQRGIESAYSWAAQHAQQAACAALDVENERRRPFVLFGARIMRDGDRWCALLGEDLAVGVAGFGASPAEAAYEFDKAWDEKTDAVCEHEWAVSTDPLLMGCKKCPATKARE